MSVRFLVGSQSNGAISVSGVQETKHVRCCGRFQYWNRQATNSRCPTGLGLHQQYFVTTLLGLKGARTGESLRKLITQSLVDCPTAYQWTTQGRVQACLLVCARFGQPGVVIVVMTGKTGSKLSFRGTPRRPAQPIRYHALARRQSLKCFTTAPSLNACN